MGVFLTALIWAILIVTILILGVCLFFCVVALKGLCNYVEDKTMAHDWFVQEEFSAYCTKAIKEWFT